MPEPNPILGLHVAPGAVAWAQVLRNADGSFRVLDWAVERASDDATVAVARAAEVAVRRPFRGRGAFIALPDGSGCLATASMQPDELDLAGDDLTRELHEYTPFEPDVASLRFRLARTEGRKRDFVVAAIPAAQERRFLDAASGDDDGTIGYGFAGTSLVRGARSLGLIGTTGCLVELLPRTTHVYAIDDARVRRYLVAAGADDIVLAAAKALSRDPGDVRRQIETGSADDVTQHALSVAADAVADDVRTLAAYHVAQRYAPKDAPDDLPPTPFVAVGPLLSRAPLRRALATHLGDAFMRPGPGAASIALTWGRPPGDDLPSVVGAVGAALEAFEPAETRLALRHPPREVQEFRESRTWLWAAAVVVLGLGAAAAWIATRPPGTLAWMERTSTVGVRSTAAGAGTTAPVAPPPPAADRTPALDSEAMPGGAVRIRWSGCAAGTTWRLVRLDPAADTWTTVTSIEASAGETVDDPPGPTGTYRWRLLGAGDGAPEGAEGTTETTLDRLVPVESEFLGIDATGRARFRLRRTWRGDEVAADLAALPGEAVATRRDADGAAGAVALVTGLVVRALRIRDEEVTVRVPVAEFDEAGRVVRAADGSVPRVDREVARNVRVHEVDVARTPTGPVTTVSRKMTDG